MADHCFHAHWGCLMMDDLRCDCQCMDCTLSKERDDAEIDARIEWHNEERMREP